VPVLLTLLIAVKTHNVILGLFVGVFAGVLILHGLNPFTGVSVLISDYLVVQVSKSSHAGILILMAFIGGLVGLMEKSGGAAAFAAMVIKYISSKTKAKLAAWFSGTLLFFTDSGTPLIVGPLFQPIMDGMKISRVKLAWIVDSTASPVAVLIPFIGWGLYSQGLIAQEYSELGINEDAFSTYVKAIPFQFYSLLAVIMVPLLILLQADFGPMKRAEDKCAAKQMADQGNTTQTQDNEFMALQGKAKPIMVWLPLSLMMIILFAMLIPQGFPYDMSHIPANAFRSSLSTAYIFAAGVLMLLMAKYGIKSLTAGFTLYLQSIAKMVNILIILILAWSLGAVGKDLGTARFIVSLADGSFPAYLIPMIAFLVGAVISFATGSSWGTYAILIPLIVPMAHHFDAPMYVSIGAVLSGGLFGDHCSPISDTTILSATGAGCSQLDHVKTQLPYCLFNGACCVIGFIYAGITASIWGLAISFVLMFAGLLVIKRLISTS
ncbi:MAG TPA: sodium:proton exchanger, partial [Oceanospirillales bacterium]|nr:sodium:proton exchanger [Oceanospirillales bacterium]